MTTRLVLALALAFAPACSKKQDEPPPTTPPQISEAELKQAVDACTAYAEKLCACTAPAAKEECPLAKGVPEAIDVAKRLATNPKADVADAAQAASSIKKMLKRCVEQTARLPELGC